MARYAALMVLMLFSASILAQQGGAGFPPYASFQDGQFDAINLGNLNVHQAYPIVSVPGRGLGLSFNVTYDSALYGIITYSPLAKYWSPLAGGWIIEPGNGRIIGGGAFELCDIDQQYNQHFSGFSYTEPNGTNHAFATIDYYEGTTACWSGGPPPPGDYATDGSGFYLSTANDDFFVISPSGIKIRTSGDVTTAGNTYDTNGNFLHQPPVLGWPPASTDDTDTVGRAALSVLRVPTPGPPNYPPADHYDYKFYDVNGNRQTVTLHFQAFNVKTNFGCPGIVEYSYPNVALPTSLVLPNGQSYTFTYEDTPGFPGYTTMRLKRVTLPTGGYYEYQYPGGGVSCSDGSLVAMMRVVYDGTNTSTWTYTRVQTENTATRKTWKTYVTKPQSPSDTYANQCTYSFTEMDDATTGWVTGRENVKRDYQGSEASGQLLRTEDTVFSCTGPASQPVCRPSSTTVTLDNGLQSKTEADYDTYGNVQETREYDWGTSAPGSLLRRTTLSYLTDPNYISRNILNRPKRVVVKDGGGNIRSRTDIQFDSTPLTCMTTTPAVPQHDDANYGCSMTFRGNPTAVTQYTDPVTPAGAITVTSVYDSLGNLRSVTDPGQHTPKFYYDDNYSDGLNRNTYAYLTKTTKPAPFDSQTITSSYFYYTGQPASATDENSRVTTFAYADPLNRPTQTNFPDGGSTTLIYFDPSQMDVQRSMTGTANAYSSTLLDALGRVSRVAKKNGEAQPWDQQDSCYDNNGRLSFQSYSYQGNGWSTAKVCSGAGDTLTYDALGRTTSVTHSDGTSVLTSYSGRATQVQDEGNGSSRINRIIQSDALGRLTGVCEVYSGPVLLGGGGTPASCGLDITGSGFLTSYGYDTLGNMISVTQGSLSARTYAYDSLSRRTSETTPEAGTVSYTYNADGLLATRVRPAPNQTDPTKTVTTSYAYDELHRLRNRTYASSDPANNPVNTPSPTFNYDEASVWNTTLSNPLGRLTSESVSGSLPAKQIFSYDPMGRPKLNAQCTPNTCNASPFTPYTLNYQYDFLGNVTQAGNGVGVTFTNSYNIAGRLTGVTSSLNDPTHPATLLSGATFSPSTVTDTLGNGVIETTSFSPRGMLTSYQASAPSGQPGTGSVLISGALQTYQQLVQAAAPATAGVTITGSENSVTTPGNTYCGLWDDTGYCIQWVTDPPTTTYDSGSVTITVNGHADSVGYGSASTGATIASDLAGAINADGSASVNASASNGVLSLTARQTGTVGNSYSWSVSTSSYDPADFGSGSFGSSPPSGTMSGGQNAVYQTAYDSGSTTVTVNNHPDSYSWSGSATTAASIAQGVCNAINGDAGAPVTASTNGNSGQCPLGSAIIGLVAKQAGSGGDYPVRASSNSVVNSFSTSCPGFPTCATASLSGGGNPVYSFTLGRAADGQVTAAGDYVNGNWVFSYDQFNRLASSNKGSGQQTFTYDYDRYGNRWHQNAPQGGPAPQYLFDNNNHIVGSGITYDALGEILTDGLGNSFTWDAEGRLIQVKQGSTVVATYSYDAEGRRVHGPNGEYIYDLAGHMITQMGLNGVWNYGEIYAGGRHLATYSGGTTNFMHGDWLGTKRVMSALNGTVSQTCTGFAFGDGVSCVGTNWSFNGFTDDIHDFETNLEHTLFRQYSGTQGRWLTPDPYMGSMDPANPQSFNRYAYVGNNPVDLTDQTGLLVDLIKGQAVICGMDGLELPCGNVLPWIQGRPETFNEAFDRAVDNSRTMRVWVPTHLYWIQIPNPAYDPNEPVDPYNQPWSITLVQVRGHWETIPDLGGGDAFGPPEPFSGGGFGGGGGGAHNDPPPPPRPTLKEAALQTLCEEGRIQTKFGTIELVVASGGGVARGIMTLPGAGLTLARLAPPVAIASAALFVDGIENKYIFGPLKQKACR